MAQVKLSSRVKLQMQTTALVLLAHGSRDPATSLEMKKLVEHMTKIRPQWRISGAFLSLAEPGLGEAVAAAVEARCRSIRILPLFLFTGKHLKEDIPALMPGLKAKYPLIRLRLLKSIGSRTSFADFLFASAGS